MRLKQQAARTLFWSQASISCCAIENNCDHQLYARLSRCESISFCIHAALAVGVNPSIPKSQNLTFLPEEEIATLPDDFLHKSTYESVALSKTEFLISVASVTCSIFLPLRSSGRSCMIKESVSSHCKRCENDVRILQPHKDSTHWYHR
jgi:hypothetical protein